MLLWEQAASRKPSPELAVVDTSILTHARSFVDEPSPAMQAALQDSAPPALNVQSVPGRAASADRLDEFDIESDLAGPRTWIIRERSFLYLFSLSL